jgi:hypothetical protein
MGWKCISVGELLRREVKAKTPHGAKIQQAFKEYRYGK